MPAPDNELVFNGVDGSTGNYLLPPLPASTISAVARGETLDSQQLSELRFVNQRATTATLGPVAGIDPKQLKETGWAVIFAADSPPQIREALQELLDHRRTQATENDARFYREYSGVDGYRPGESKLDFLARHGAGPGPADPLKVPYYLLIVGDPAVIPYRFQYQLDVQYAVGRLWFEKIEDFANYARSVVAAEQGKVKLPRRATFFGVANPDDRATQLSSKELVSPLVDVLDERLKAAGGDSWTMNKLLAEQTTKQALSRVLGGDDTPALLFTASHGMGFPRGDVRQRPHQGALLCQDWKGPVQHRGAISPDTYFAGDDVASDAHLQGLIAFHFACYGAGTPRMDEFAQLAFRQAEPIADKAFISALPQRLLAHPKGGALAVIGHVERAWGYSFHWERAGRQLQAFQSTLQELMTGSPIGAALEYFNVRYAELSSDLTDELQEIRFGKPVDDFAIAGMWTANNDARNYLIFGDPAVRLPVANVTAATRPQLDPLQLSLPPMPGPPGPLPPAPANAPQFQTPPPPAVPPAPPAPLPPATVSAPRASGAHVSAATIAIGGETTITIPLHISISLGSIAGATSGAAARQNLGDSSSLAFGVEIDPDYRTRAGYDPDFLGSESLRVPLPKLTAALRSQAAVIKPEHRIPGASRHELKYYHYSVVMNAERRLAFFTAVNINGRQIKEIGRETDSWIFDPRIDEAAQAAAELYVNNPFDKGHLVRRLDPVWGRTPQIAKLANDDTYHYTNCSPQHAKFNRGKKLWQGVENYLLARASDEEQKLTVFSGPVFQADDPMHRGVRIPRQYWKVCVLKGTDGSLASIGFLLTQEDLFADVSFANIDVARTFQTSVAEIETLTGLEFGRLKTADVGTVDSFAIGDNVGTPAPRRELSTLDDMRLPRAPLAASFSPAFGPPGFVAPGRALEPVPNTDLGYYLLAFDASCQERLDHPAGKISDFIVESVHRNSITDIFLFSHGWQGDVTAAREQYVGWLQAMAGLDADRQRVRQVREGFRPMLIGVHWPSLPWGDERLGAASFAANQGSGLPKVIDDFVKPLGETPEVRSAVSTIVKAAESGSEPEHLPPDVAEAYRKLADVVMAQRQGLANAPEEDQASFDAEAVYQDARLEGGTVPSFSLFSRDTLLAPLRSLSFWRMKDLARKIGEQAVHPFLVRLQEAIGDRDIRLHLAGHSFGCIVCSAGIAGPAQGASAITVSSLSLLQGALSLWGYCAAIPHGQQIPGYFHRLIREQRVRGPIVTTNSAHDSAVGVWYPRAAGLARQVAFAPAFGQNTLPKYGAIGTFGIQGTGLPLADVNMLPADGDYNLRSGQIYNVNGSGIINVKNGWGGAHSDIRKPEVAHLVWSAILAGDQHADV